MYTRPARPYKYWSFDRKEKIRVIADLLSTVTYLKLNFNLTLKYIQIQLEDKKLLNKFFLSLIIQKL